MKYGPYTHGDYVMQRPSEFGIVYAAGPKCFYVLWESGSVSRHAQDFEGLERAQADAWHGDKAYEARTKAEIQRELAVMCRERIDTRGTEWKIRRGSR